MWIISSILLLLIVANPAVANKWKCGTYDGEFISVQLGELLKCKTEVWTKEELLESLDKLNRSIEMVHIYQYFFTLPVEQINPIVHKIFNTTSVKALILGIDCSSIDSETFKYGDNLTVLHLGKTNIKWIGKGFLRNLKNLRELEFTVNIHITFDEMALSDLKSLVRLSLYANKATPYPSRLFKENTQLKVLNIQRNSLEYLDLHWFSTLYQLEHLILGDNLLKVIPSNIFQNNLKLRYLVLDRNRIKVIGRQNLNIFKNLLLLNLHVNLCTTEFFEFDQDEVTRGTSGIIEGVLFPLCDENGLGLMKTSKVAVSLKIVIICCCFVLIISATYFIKRRYCKNKIQNFSRNFIDVELQPIVREYVQESSIHGIKYIAEGKKHWLERLFWTLMFLLSFIFSMTFILEAYEKWEDSPILFGLSQTKTKVHQVPFPTITVCSEKKLWNLQKAWSPEDLKDFGSMDWTAFEAHSQICPTLFAANVELFKNLTLEQSSETSNLYTLNSSLHSYSYRQRLMEKSIFWQKKIIYYEGYPLTDAGVCTYFNNLLPEQIFKPFGDPKFIRQFARQNNYRDPEIINWNTENIYNENDRFSAYPFRMLKASSIPALEMSINYTKASNEIPCENEIWSFKVLVHHPGDWPFVSEKSFTVSTNVVAALKITPKVTKTSTNLKSYKPNTRKCFFQNENPLKYFNIYSKTNCEFECWVNFTIKACGCAAFYMPRNPNETRTCNYFDRKCLNIAKNNIFIPQESASRGSEYYKLCECYPACNSIEYDVTLTQTPLETERAETNGSKLISLILQGFIEEDEFIALERSELFGFTDFVGICGGMLGLFMGVSVLSIIELLYYIFIKLLVGTFRKRMTRKTIENPSNTIYYIN